MKNLALITLVALTSFGYSQNNEESKPVEFFDVEHPAKFEGGETALQRYIAKEVKYPQKALDMDAQGTVYVMFVVNRDGSVSNVEVMGDANKYLKAEAIRVIKSTSGMWTPAMQRGKKVRMRFRIPIKFHITGNTTTKKKRKLFRRD